MGPVAYCHSKSARVRSAARSTGPSPFRKRARAHGTAQSTGLTPFHKTACTRVRGAVQSARVLPFQTCTQRVKAISKARVRVGRSVCAPRSPRARVRRGAVHQASALPKACACAARGPLGKHIAKVLTPAHGAVWSARLTPSRAHMCERLSAVHRAIAIPKKRARARQRRSTVRQADTIQKAWRHGAARSTGITLIKPACAFAGQSSAQGYHFRESHVCARQGFLATRRKGGGT